MGVTSLAEPKAAAATRAASAPVDVEFRGVTKRFGAVVAVDAISFEIPRGSFHSFLGPSGCGKTTSLRLIAGFEQPDQGEVSIGGRSMVGVPAYRRPVNMVFQHYALFPHMNVADNVGYGLRQARPKLGQGRDRHARRRDAGAGAPAAGWARGAPGSCPAGSSSAWPWPARWSTARRCCCWTSRWRRWTASCAATCRSSCRTCSATSASPSSW